MQSTENNFDVVILTQKCYINPTAKDWYTKQVLIEEKLVQKALEKKGLRVCKKDWSDNNFDWTKTNYALFRTTWDYFDRFNEFKYWLNKTKNKTNFINSEEIIRWNIDKHYLQDLSKKNINIAPTRFIKQGEKKTIQELFLETNWKEAVLKPAISGAARHTYRITSNNYKVFENIFKKLIKKESMVFQEFLKNITINGEISLIMIGGEYTHAVKKIAKKGDFRVQDDHGGIVQKYSANNEEIKFAENCLQATPFKPTYARVDIVYDNKNKPSLSELELIEPELWFRNYPKAADLLAEKIFQEIS